MSSRFPDGRTATRAQVAYTHGARDYHNCMEKPLMPDRSYLSGYQKATKESEKFRLQMETTKKLRAMGISPSIYQHMRKHGMVD
jgi:hypothetical protein